MNRRIHIAAAAALCLVAGCGEESPQQQLMKGMQSAVEGDETAALALPAEFIRVWTSHHG